MRCKHTYVEKRKGVVDIERCNRWVMRYNHCAKCDGQITTHEQRKKNAKNYRNAKNRWAQANRGPMGY